MDDPSKITVKWAYVSAGVGWMVFRDSGWAPPVQRRSSTEEGSGSVEDRSTTLQPRLGWRRRPC
jgi:hypothetical protein